jgi:hypothetical protein
MISDSTDAQLEFLFYNATKIIYIRYYAINISNLNYPTKECEGLVYSMDS